MVLKSAVDRDYQFIIEDVLDGRAPVTNTMIKTLLDENQKKTLVNLIAISKDSNSTRPKYINLDKKNYRNNLKKALGMGANMSILEEDNKDDEGIPEIHTIDIINIALKMNMRSSEMVELL